VGLAALEAGTGQAPLGAHVDLANPPIPALRIEEVELVEVSGKVFFLELRHEPFPPAPARPTRGSHRF
jgi:hypothetical protein